MRVIMHIDLNCYFVSAERRINPNLNNKPVIVCNMGRRAVAAAVSYEAREYGIKAGMPWHHIVKKCPHIISVDHNFELYIKTSREFFNYLGDKVGKKMEIGSLDEAYIDITHIANSGKSLSEFAKQLIKNIKKDLNLPVSIGISTNKFLAKMASDMKKPLNYTILNRDNIKELLWPLPIKKYFQIGPAREAMCLKNDIKTIGDLAKCTDDSIIREIFKNQGKKFVMAARGESDSIIESSPPDIKTISNEHTTEHDVIDYLEILTYFRWLSKSVTQRLKSRNKKCKIIGIVVRWAHGELKKWPTITKQTKMQHYIDNENQILKIVMDLFLEAWDEKPLRKVGVFVGDLKNSSEIYQPISLFDDNNEKSISTINNINYKFGKKVLMSGKDYKLKKSSKYQKRFIVEDSIKPDLDNLKKLKNRNEKEK